MTAVVTPDQLRQLTKKRSRFERMAGEPIRTEYGGRVYASRVEAEHAKRLDLELRAGLIKTWEPQRRIRIVLEGLLICTWIPDFLVVTLTDDLEAHETKGRGQLDDRRDWPIKAKLALVLKLVDRVRVFRGALEVEAPRPLPPPLPRKEAPTKATPSATSA